MKIRGCRQGTMSRVGQAGLTHVQRLGWVHAHSATPEPTKHTKSVYLTGSRKVKRSEEKEQKKNTVKHFYCLNAHFCRDKSIPAVLRCVFFFRLIQLSALLSLQVKSKNMNLFCVSVVFFPVLCWNVYLLLLPSIFFSILEIVHRPTPEK